MENQLTGKKILFATVPADGHFNPLTGLAKYLQQLGCDVRWYTSPLFSAKLEKLDITHYPFKQALDVNSANVDDVFPERKYITDAAAKLDYDISNIFVNRALECLDDITEIAETFDFDLLVADSLFSAIPLVKAKLKVPVVAIGVVPLAEDSVDLPPYGMGLLPPSNLAERKEYAVLKDLVKNAIFKNSIDKFSAILNGYQIVHHKAMLFDVLIKQSDLYLQIGTPGFEYERSDISNHVRFVGGMLPYNANTAKSEWFNEKILSYKKIILVTQGTVETDTAKLLEPVLKAFRDTDTLVVATTGGHGTKELRQKYTADNLLIEDYVSFDTIMPYVNLYVTNGGYSGVLLAIKHNLPIVAAGLHEGKNEICARIGYFKYGVNLNIENPSEGQIRDAVNEVLENNEYRKNVDQLAESMNSYDSLSLCARYIGNLINETAVVREA